MTKKNRERIEAAVMVVAGVVFAMAANTAQAQGIPLDFLDTMKGTFDSLRLHPIWPSIAACGFVASVGIFLKTHDMRALFGAIGTAVFIGFWAKQAGVLANIGLP